jgi:hypothetical protein
LSPIKASGSALSINGSAQARSWAWPWREHQLDGIAKGIDQRMDFGRQSAAGSADRLFAAFFRAPALC